MNEDRSSESTATPSVDISSAAEAGEEWRRAIAIGRDFERKRWELAELLTAIRCYAIWRDTGAATFEMFVVEHVRINLRTAQELVPRKAKCDALKIPRAQIDELGWSKLSAVVPSLNAQNKDDLLADVKQLSLRKLREKHTNDAPAGKSKSHRHFQVTQRIQEAVSQAARHTMSNEFQDNLEFVCVKFLEAYPLSRDLRRKFSPN